MANVIKPLQDAYECVDFFLDAIQLTWEERGYDVQVKELLKEKIELVKDLTSKVKGLVLFVDNMPAGISWVENNTGHYGNIVLFSLRDIYRETLVNATLDAGYFNGKLLEIVVIEDTEEYYTILDRINLVKNSRQRMCYWLDEGNHIPLKDHDYEIVPLTKNDLDISGQISYDAHKVSKDYEMYPDLTDPIKRIALEKRVHDGLYGPAIDGASTMLMHKGEVLATCFIIEVKCWGYEKVPWVFDLVVRPEYHSKGIGRLLMSDSLNKLLDLKYPICGLAVTNTNEFAYKLYDNLGFQFVDNFYEYIRVAH